MKAIVTGGAGFIGSELVRQLVASGVQVIVIDNLTYAATREALATVEHRLVKLDICDGSGVADVLADERPQVVYHLAAETHVDRSIDDAAAFVRTNVLGTHSMLEQCTRHWEQQPADHRDTFRFVHVSTDEVFGSIGEGLFDERSPYDPRSPYAASKAASDHLVAAWHRTHAFPALITHCGNNFGPYQFPDKLIPLMVIKRLAGQPMPIYGDGNNVRDWIHVSDHARALRTIAAEGTLGERYVIGASTQLSNLEVVKRICTHVDALEQAQLGESLIQFVADRPGHDQRYALDATKLATIGWAPRRDFDTALRATVQWYVDQRSWWQPLMSNRYGGERLGSKRRLQP